MKIPRGLQPLIDDGIVDAVLRQLKSGKEASVFLVDCGGQLRCAKVYKDAEHRGFHKLAAYQEGRKARGSRDARALAGRGRQGRKLQETQWKNAEVDALYRLAAAGVRVPQPYGVFDGVLLMEFIRDEHDQPAPRLNEVDLTAGQAREWHAFLIGQIVRMLCSGLIHGDLSAFNVLVDAAGPVIIDLPQAVDAASNNNAFRMFERDVNNMRDAFVHALPELAQTQYAHEIWSLYERGELRPDSALTGHFEHPSEAADVDAVLAQIDEARREAEAREQGRRRAEAE
ncbi:PA4780 family RIO1-like protein kinase [Sinimarinibacterium flocculans]|uniref:PA4780 family RIO1-like protein kinase n=1 Tax=Sinimarinibacterium flocculans TaxID=985250 RepID=UPI0035122AA2